MKLADFKLGDTFCLQNGGPSFTVLEHIAGFHPTVRCSSINAKLQQAEEHCFAAHFQGIPITFAGEAVPAPRADGSLERMKRIGIR